MGMLFMPALLSGLFVLAAYMAGASLVQLPNHELIYNGTILLFSNVLRCCSLLPTGASATTRISRSTVLRDMANRDGLTGIHNRRAF
jgi:hypothetical protein